MKKIHVYSHTHWDYEWYFTSSESIIQLIYHMDEVIKALQEGILTTYLLDSQVSILEEYLCFMPEKYDVVKQLVQDGKLQIGPWYTQSDELIISGESMIRNLWYGMSYAKRLGACLKIGYLPDSFGQSKDMPKLYQGFDIQHALFWRGVPNDVCSQREFVWESSDGSRVHVYNIRDGYFYGGNLIYNDDVEQVENRIKQGATIQDQLLPVGGDQRYVDFNLQERIAYYNTHTTQDFHYEESDLKTFFEALQKEDLPIMKGEFIDASVSKIHHSIYSTRYDHKQLNDQVERRLIYQLEPFMVMQMQMGITPKVSVLEKLWKKLLLNHAHDSACGCNSDETNQSILQRLMDCDQMSTMMLDYQVRKVSESIEDIKDGDLVLYNTLPYTRAHTQHIPITTKLPYFDILDQDGQRVPFDIVSSEKIYAGSIRKDESSYHPDLYYYQTKIRINYRMDPMSFQVINIIEKKAQVIPYVPTSFENDIYKITMEEGMLHVLLKSTQEEIKDFLYVEDDGDDGDSYDYSPYENDLPIKLDFRNAVVSYSGQHVPCMELKGNWMLPKQLHARKQHVHTMKTVYHVQIYLDQEDTIKVNMTIDNKAMEHRMRVLVRSFVESEDSVADTAFGTIQRKHQDAHLKDWKACGYREEPTAIYPMLHHVSLVDEARSVTCYVQGIKEYEIVNHQDIALTLFRSVPFLGKPDLKRRPGIASGNEFKYIETPDACLYKTLSYTFAIAYKQNYDANQVQKQWMNEANDYLYYQIQDINRFVNTQKYFVTHPYNKRIKRSIPTISFDHLQYATYSSIAPLDDKRFQLRIYNTAQECVEEHAIILEEMRQVRETNLCQTVIKDCAYDGCRVRIEDMKCEEIKTFEIVLK